MNTSTELNCTPVYQSHIDLNAKMVPFGGWDMPVQYEGILAEYHHTRQAASLFDISHMGEFLIEGNLFQTGLDRIVTQKLSDLPVKSCRYGAMLNEQGGILDDLIVFRIDEEKWFLVVNAATTSKDFAHLKANLSDKAVLTDLSLQTGKLDLQGPKAREILRSFVQDIDKLDYYSFDYFNLLGEDVLISRTGYTGELGYEIYYPWDKTDGLWNELLKLPGVKAAGLGARDILRLEVGYSLYGHELGEDISPVESGLMLFVDLEKDFIGKGAVEKINNEGSSRKLIGFQSKSRRSPREGHFLYSKEGKNIGTVSSGTFSPALERGIGLGFISDLEFKRGDSLKFGNDKSSCDGIISSKIFYREGSLKN